MKKWTFVTMALLLCLALPAFAQQPTAAQPLTTVSVETARSYVHEAMLAQELYICNNAAANYANQLYALTKDSDPDMAQDFLDQADAHGEQMKFWWDYGNDLMALAMSGTISGTYDVYVEVTTPTGDVITGTWTLTNTVPAQFPTPDPALGASAPPIGTVESCITTAQAKTLIGLDVQRLATEPCAWVWRAAPNASGVSLCPNGFVCTLHVKDIGIQVFVGKTEAKVVAGTWRYAAAYPLDDTVRDTCALLAKEQTFGKSEDPSFDVTAGNFTCP